MISQDRLLNGSICIVRNISQKTTTFQLHLDHNQMQNFPSARPRGQTQGQNSQGKRVPGVIMRKGLLREQSSGTCLWSEAYSPVLLHTAATPQRTQFWVYPEADPVTGLDILNGGGGAAHPQLQNELFQKGHISCFRFFQEWLWGEGNSASRHKFLSQGFHMFFCWWYFLQNIYQGRDSPFDV